MPRDSLTDLGPVGTRAPDSPVTGSVSCTRLPCGCSSMSLLVLPEANLHSLVP